MNTFLTKFPSEVVGVLSGFDRVIMRGTIRRLAYLGGMSAYLATNRVQPQDFKQHAMEVTARLREAVEGPVLREGRPVLFLNSGRTDKEKLVGEIVARDGLGEGTICLLSCVEPCRTYQAHGDRQKRTVDLRPHWGKCTAFYKYSFHPQLGYIHARIQSWFPFPVQVYFNGREWLTRQLEAAGLGYRRADNTLLWVEDLGRAQELLDDQLQTCWPKLLEGILCDLNPLQAQGWLGQFYAPYYWTTFGVEWATDMMFRTPEALAQWYPALALHSMRTLSCTDVLRFYGRGPRFTGEVRSKLVVQKEGLRTKHRAAGNFLKAYDKAYAVQSDDWSVLRIETTTNHPEVYKAFRTTENHPEGPKRWLPLRKGVADLHRLTQVSQAANDRYADALAAADCSESVATLASRLTQPVTHRSRRVRGLRPWPGGDLPLLRAVNEGDHLLNGFRNRDLRARLYAKPTDDHAEQRRRSARVGRLLRLLRAHGLIKKIPKTHRYQMTEFGRRVVTALLTALDATTAELARLAAVA